MRRLLAVIVTALLVPVAAAQASTLAQAKAILPKLYGRDAAFMRCIIGRESGWDHRAISPTGDYGLAQLNRATWARHFGSRWKLALDPVGNLCLAREVLRIQGRDAWANGRYPCP